MDSMHIISLVPHSEIQTTVLYINIKEDLYHLSVNMIGVILDL